MKTAIVTDGKYRSSIAAVRALHRAGYQVIVTQTRADVHAVPAVASSRCCAAFRWIDGAAADDGYADRLTALLETYDRPVLFCVGAVTLNTVAAQWERFARIADFLIAPRPVLDALNDKETVHARAQSLGIPVPRQYDGVPPERYPVVIKPHCGEKFGLKAADRYAVADTPEAYAQILARMQRYDPSPIVQDKIAGPGIGVSLLLDRDGRMISALCHRRIREYPITGGPSTCCESFYDAALIDRAYRLLHSFGFTGMAMVEFKGDCLLEVNPRVWGSFPMTEAAQSPLVAHYARAAAGERRRPLSASCSTGISASRRSSRASWRFAPSAQPTPASATVRTAASALPWKWNAWRKLCGKIALHRPCSRARESPWTSPIVPSRSTARRRCRRPSRASPRCSMPSTPSATGRRPRSAAGVS